MNQNTRGGFRKARSLSAIGIAAPSVRGGGRISADIRFIRRIRRSIRGVPETMRHGIEFGLLVAAVDEQSSWKSLGVVREKACSRFSCPIHPGLAQEPNVDCTMAMVDAKVK